jgi:predicted transcriptional regulator
VSTFILRLCNKGLISSKRNGREYCYTALVTEEEYNELQTKAFVQKTYNGNAKGLVAALIKNDFLSAEDIDELNRFWHEKVDEKNG